MEGTEKVLDLLIQTGLNWSVNKLPLVSQEGFETNSFGLFRSDNNAHVGTVGNQYQVYDNYELAEAIIQATESIGISATRGGELNGGKKVYIQASLPDEYVGKSALQRWVTGLNAHDATKQIGFGSSGTVVVCQNTFHKAYGELSKFRHTMNAKERIIEFVSGMRRAIGLDEGLIERFKIMADLPIKDEIFARVISKAYNVDLDVKSSEISTRQKTKLESVAKAIEIEIGLEGATLWGLFNGITRYTNHVANVKEGRREEYLMTGAGYDTNLVAFETIMKWVEENSVGYEKELAEIL